MNKKDVAIFIVAILLIIGLASYVGHITPLHKIKVGANGTSSFNLPNDYRVSTYHNTDVMLYNKSDIINVTNVSNIRSINGTVDTYQNRSVNDTFTRKDMMVDNTSVIKTVRAINTTVDGVENANNSSIVVTKYWFEKNNIKYCITIVNATSGTEETSKEIIRTMVNSDVNGMFSSLQRGDVEGLKNSMFN